MATRSEIALLVTAVAATCGSLAIAVAHPAGWAGMGREDGPVEIASVFAFLALAGIAAARFARSPRGARAPSVAAALAGLVGAGEEISWGQRLLGLSSPEFFSAHNVQGETNLHNLLHPPWDGVLAAVLVLGFCLAPAWRKTSWVEALVRRGLPWPRPIHVAVLTGCLATGLAVAAVTHARELEEVGELLLVLVAAAVWSGPAPARAAGVSRRSPQDATLAG